MVFKVLSFLALIALTSSVPAPDPEPEPGVIMDVSQVVEGEGCGGNKYCPKPAIGCVLSGKSYPNEAVIDDACVKFRCNKGVWEFKKIIDDWEDKCGMCQLHGDPNITPFEPHNLTNLPWPNPLTSYYSNNTGNMVVSKPGGPAGQRFGVHSGFEADDVCTLWPGTCVENVTYYEPGVVVNIILPVDLGDIDICFYDSSNWAYPKCSTTKIFVNDLEYTLEELAPATSFSGTDGTTLIFKESCVPHNTYEESPVPANICQEFYVVGSQGYTIRLVVDPSWIYGYSLDVYATRSQLLNNVYGLCDVFTGETVTDGFTCGNGTMITDYNDLDEFKNCWDLGP